MSHFTVVVLVPQIKVAEPGHPDFENQLEAAVSVMLAPFDESLDVPTYSKTCWCAESAVNREADRLASEETGLNWNDLRNSWWAKPEAERELSSWEDYTSELRRAEERHRRLLTPSAKPLADCSNCHGTGAYDTEYNPLSKWDWYVVGGRWDGDFTEKGIPTIIDNVAFARDLHSAAYVPYAILSPREPHQKKDYDNWNERGQMGWFGISSNENDNWDAIALELLDKYSACFAVLVDCHI